jgi:hypothetical protein
VLGSLEVLEAVLAEVRELDTAAISPATSSRVELDTRTWPPCAAEQMRAARCTSMPT